jgi:cytochrome c peroxidase
MKGGFYHDGRFATLDEVVKHYQAVLKIDLNESEQSDLIEY